MKRAIALPFFTLICSCLIIFSSCSDEQETITGIQQKDILQKTQEQEKPLVVAEEMPLFGDCTETECSNKKLLEFIYKNIKYPQEARTKEIEGTVVIRFVVEKDGSITNIEPVREVKGGCTEASIAVVEKLPNFTTPAKQDGKLVRVQFNLPIRFKLT